MICTSLENSGYDVVYSTTPKVIEETRKDAPSLIIMNNSQERMDYLKTIRNDSELAFTPVICVSDKQDRENEAEGFSLGVNDFLYRPLDAQKLLSSVRRIEDIL
ncbi:MAG: response regulator [Nitrospira sp.]|nr:response regulator [bacterium]MBL7049697.1 response regulator [Nitrospira sp.]